jgi:biotin transport system substrate-specific component
MTQSVIAINSEHKSLDSKYLPTLVQILAGSLFIALCAQVKIPLFFSPVPLSLQTLAVMLVAGFLGKSKGTLAVLTYLGQLSMGLPVAAGGVALPLALIGPTGGYLLGFVLQAYLTGWCIENKSRFHPLTLLISLFSISLIQLGTGAIWLGAFVGLKNSLIMGFSPFLPGECLKVIAAATLFSKRHT